MAEEDITAGTEPGARHRDANNTRQLLLAAARRRFAGEGYVATTVRDIAGDAGVNVALINRYFTSKEGLFEACLATAVDELDRSIAGSITADQVLTTMLAHVTGSPSGDDQLRLRLLLQSSGDDRADEIRRAVFQTFAERLARAVSVRGTEPDRRTLLRAEIVLSSILGMILVRSSMGLEPLASADAQELAAPLGELLSTLLP